MKHITTIFLISIPIGWITFLIPCLAIPTVYAVGTLGVSSTLYNVLGR